MSIFSLLSPGLYWLLISFSSTAEVDFSRDIQPILSEHCINCHGNEKPKGGLEMTTREGMLKELKSGERAIIPGKPGQSELLRRLASDDPDELGMIMMNGGVIMMHGGWS